jgi:hypothetical protein
VAGGTQGQFRTLRKDGKPVVGIRYQRAGQETAHREDSVCPIVDCRVFQLVTSP